MTQVLYFSYFSYNLKKLIETSIYCERLYSVVVITEDSDSFDPSSNLGTTFLPLAIKILLLLINHSEGI